MGDVVSIMPTAFYLNEIVLFSILVWVELVAQASENNAVLERD